ncbi:MAG: penicillin-binding protein 2 [Ignavibacteriaceae bacterium]|nr:penicillin-binding protein 2 [Ignavibacteriaceae bacterium]
MTLEKLHRKSILTFFVTSVFFVFIFRLFYMQIISQQRYEERSSDNSVKAIVQTPFRGVFYDRNLKLLVENMPTYSTRVTPADFDTKNIPLLEVILNLQPGTIQRILDANKLYSKYIPVRVKKGCTSEEVGLLEENSHRLEGVDYVIDIQRGYSENVKASHIFGYLREIGQKELERDSGKYYILGDQIGFIGLEKKYEEFLRGEKGYQYTLVDSRRRTIGKYKDGTADVQSSKGKDLVLSLDSKAQSVAEQELIGRSGAVVAIEPKTGEILVLASAPDYDLSEFSDVLNPEYLRNLQADKLKPQYNRATLSTFPPGSTFKVLCALAGLEMGAITLNSTLPCSGGFTFGRFFKCHGAHGAVGIAYSIEQSCNTFYYQLIFKIGLDRLHDFAKKFGIGVKTGIDLLEESSGLIPNEEYYIKRYGKDWPRGILVSLGIGQGEISLTPLQLAHSTALIANNGKGFEPHVVKGYLDENKNYVPFQFKEIDTEVKQENIDIVKYGMFLVVEGNGTATNIRTPGIQIAGKTGTAQNPHGNDHSLFIAFAPYEDPQIAISVIVENAGYGSAAAAPLAQKVIAAYLESVGYKKDDIKIAVMQ